MALPYNAQSQLGTPNQTNVMQPLTLPQAVGGSNGGAQQQAPIASLQGAPNIAPLQGVQSLGTASAGNSANLATIPQMVGNNTSFNNYATLTPQSMQGGSFGGAQYNMPQLGVNPALAPASMNVQGYFANLPQNTASFGYNGAQPAIQMQGSPSQTNYLAGQTFQAPQLNSNSNPSQSFQGAPSFNAGQQQQAQQSFQGAPSMPGGGSPALGASPMPPMQGGQSFQGAPMVPGGSPAATAPATQSVEQQALAGGSNPQQVQNFMQALQGVGAGSNNTFQNAAANNATNQTQQAAPLYANPSQQASSASSSNNIQGYYNTGNGNMQSSGTATNPGGQVTTSSPSFNQGEPVQNPSTQLSRPPTQQSMSPAPSNTPPMSGSTQGLTTPLISDERAKTNIEPVRKDINAFLSNLTANKYEYKDKAHGIGEFVSPMAQDLEKSKLGKTMVETRPDGLKQVNYGRGFGIITAAQALMHQRQNELEKKLNKLLREKK